MRIARTANIGMRGLELIELALMIERMRFRPYPAQNVDIFGTAPISAWVIDIITVLRLIPIAPA